MRPFLCVSEREKHRDPMRRTPGRQSAYHERRKLSPTPIGFRSSIHDLFTIGRRAALLSSVRSRGGEGTGTDVFLALLIPGIRLPTMAATFHSGRRGLRFPE
jgi:hypothetical protein